MRVFVDSNDLQCGLQAACCDEHVPRWMQGYVLRTAAGSKLHVTGDGWSFGGEIELVDAVAAEVAGICDGAFRMEDGGLWLRGGLQRVRAPACSLEGVWGGKDASIERK